MVNGMSIIGDIMAEFKIVIADTKSGKCYQRVLNEQQSAALIGLKIGDNVKGDAIGLAGYEFQITGGSDYCGFPMRKGISGFRKRILAGKSVGFRALRKGERKRKTVCGETIHEKIVQVNLKILKEGTEKLGKEEEGKEKKENVKEEKSEEKKEKPAKEEKTEEKKEK